jgi:hypothetical protein
MDNKRQRVSEDVLSMRRRLGEWLAEPRPEELIRWLQGYGLPCDASEEAHVWILRGLPVAGSERLAARTQLARQVAALLRREPDVVPLGRRPEEFLHNLLMLAAGLARPEDLADPLFGMYRRGALNGKHLGGNLRVDLRIALAENQLDARLEDEWFAMLERRGTARLPGAPHQGFEGVLLMPESSATQDLPYLDAIGRALLCMAHNLEGLSARRVKFRGLLDRVTETYGKPPEFGADLVRVSDRYSWPEWASDCLPIVAFLSGGGETESRAMVWSLLVNIVPRSHSYRKIKTFCKGVFIEIVMPERTARVVWELALKVEPWVRRNPYESTSAVEEVVHHAIFEILQQEERAADEELASFFSDQQQMRAQQLYGYRD